MTQPLPFDEINFDRSGKLDDILKINQIKKNFQFCPHNKIRPKYKFKEHIKKLDLINIHKVRS